MALMELWRDAPSTVLSMPIQQIVANAGAGKLEDDSQAMAELREFLTKVDTERLDAYVSQLLAHERVDWTGFAPQDLINEVGRRLGYSVNNGRYRGVRNQVGFDGLWKAPNGSQIVVEVKTSSTYDLKLDRIAGYRQKLRESNSIGDNTSMLLVVGSQDTSGWESQIRGSRHAWDVRLVGATALTNLARLGDDDPLLLEKVRSMLVPLEYTRLDVLIELVLATSEAGSTEYIESIADNEGDDLRQVASARPESSALKQKRGSLVELIEKRENVTLDSRTGIIFSDVRKSFSFLCAISKRHAFERHGHVYWYSITPKQLAVLAGSAKSLIALGCADAAMAFIFPPQFMNEIKDRLGRSEQNGEIRHWNLPLKSPTAGVWHLMLAERTSVDVSHFLTAF